MVTNQPYTVGAVDRAMSILELIRDRSSMSIHELSAELGVTRSTIHRLLSTMRARDFLDQDPRTRAYVLGPFFTDLGVEPAASRQLTVVARPHLEALRKEFDETVQLIVLAGKASHFLDGVAADRPLQTTVRIGSRLPAHATSGGKALLAEMPDHKVRALLEDDLSALTSHTVPTIDQLLDQLRDVRRQGYAVNDGESENGIVAYAATIKDPSGTALGAVALSMPSVRATADRIPAVVAAVRRTAAAIGAELR
jgi:DNA-binding IclR family transcriptional regulator